jgi:hypothetical protein
LAWERIVASNSNLSLVANTESAIYTASCKAGKKVLGGGFALFGTSGQWSTATSGATTDTS